MSSRIPGEGQVPQRNNADSVCAIDSSCVSNEEITDADCFIPNTVLPYKGSKQEKIFLIREAVDSGVSSLVKLCKKVRMAEQTIKKYALEADITLPYGVDARWFCGDRSRRYARIARLARRGLSLEKLGGCFSVSAERARQLIGDAELFHPKFKGLNKVRMISKGWFDVSRKQGVQYKFRLAAERSSIAGSLLSVINKNGD